MRLNESSLVTAEPYHIPGYCGYCPQSKYKITESIGKTKHRAENDCSTERPIGMLMPLKKTKSKKEDVKFDLIEMREKNMGDQKYRTHMVAGYTGYIPKGQHYFGDRYALFTRNAILHMEKDQQELYRNSNNLFSIVKNSISMKAVTDKKMMYFPKGLQHSLSPYTLSIDDPRKHMMSGYTGFVPRSREIIGVGYPKITNLALCHFTSKCANKKILSEFPIFEKESTKDCQNTRTVYFENSGMVPHYTGHIPGEKFRYGHTFGYSAGTFGYSASRKSQKVE